MSTLRLIDNVAFAITVLSASVSAVAGGSGWTVTAVVSGCIAAVVPILNRWSTGRLSTAPRALTAKQIAVLQAELRKGPTFSLWLNHNREEGEPSAFHAQMLDVFKGAGLDVKWFGGLTNVISGIEISGPDSAEKNVVMNALKAAKIKFTNVHYADAPASQHSPLNTVGVSVSIGRQT
jgi:hypothetical protein